MEFLFRIKSFFLTAFEFIYEITVAQGPLVWVYRILKIGFWGQIRTKRPYNFEDFLAVMLLFLLYSLGLYSTIYVIFYSIGWLEYLLGVLGILCGYVGNKLFAYLLKREAEFYNK